jgi:predicted TIM-barrel fold metal-dependent hydrolase
MQKPAWLRRKKTAPEIPYESPLWLGPLSNGEFFLEPTAKHRRIRTEILRQCDENARRLGMDRRDFIYSAMGMCTALGVINVAGGCDDGRAVGGMPNGGPGGSGGAAGFGGMGGAGGSSGGVGSGGSETGGMGGTGGSAATGGTGGDPHLQMPMDAGMDCEVATAVLGGEEFILDMQTHHIEGAETWMDSHPGRPYQGEGFARAVDFWGLGGMSTDIDFDAYVKLVYLESDTTVGVLSGFPSPICDDATLCNSLASNDMLAMSRDEVNQLAGGSQRVIQHCQVAPNDNWSLQAQMMAKVRSEHGNWGWKCYPPWAPSGGSPFFLDDPAGIDLIEEVIKLGDKVLCIHKGPQLAGFDVAHNHPADIGRVAAMYPDVNFVVYHSGFNDAELRAGRLEGPYNPDGLGVDRLCRAVSDGNLKGKNVYAELGSAWATHMGSRPGSQHLIGKLIEHVGEDNVLWGSECTWFGSPQIQIEVFRCLQITQEFQDMFGYAALTPQVKAKILGLNAAKLYGIDATAKRSAVMLAGLEQLRRTLDGELGPRRYAAIQPQGPRTRREFLRLNAWRRANGVPA